MKSLRSVTTFPSDIQLDAFYERHFRFGPSSDFKPLCLTINLYSWLFCNAIFSLTNCKQNLIQWRICCADKTKSLLDFNIHFTAWGPSLCSKSELTQPHCASQHYRNCHFSNLKEKFTVTRRTIWSATRRRCATSWRGRRLS